MSFNSFSSSGGTPVCGETEAPLVGFRFHPTDRELIMFYLWPKIRGQENNHAHVIAEVEICKIEPWHLPVRSRIKSNDKVWYFFSRRQNKFKNSNRCDRRTEEGFWKPDGKVRQIRAKGTKEVIGSKRTLVFHRGPYKKRIRTKWVMHEYECISSSGSSNQGGFVLCKIKNKSDEKDTKCDVNHQMTLNSETESQKLVEMTTSHGICELSHLLCSNSYNKDQECSAGAVSELVYTNSVESALIIDSNMSSLSSANYFQTSSQQSSQIPKITMQNPITHVYAISPYSNSSLCHYQNNDISDPKTPANENTNTYYNVLPDSCHGDVSDRYSSECVISGDTMGDSTQDINNIDSLMLSDFENQNLDIQDGISSEIEWSQLMAACFTDYETHNQYQNSDILVPNGLLASDLE